MLAHEWQELEQLTDRIAGARDRYVHARRANNVGLMHALANDIQIASRRREQVIRQISVHLGSVTAEAA